MDLHKNQKREYQRNDYYFLQRYFARTTGSILSTTLVFLTGLLLLYAVALTLTALDQAQTPDDQPAIHAPTGAPPD